MAEFFECFLVLQLHLNTTKFKVPETYIFTYSANSGRGASANFGNVCTSKPVLNLNLIKDEAYENRYPI